MDEFGLDKSWDANRYHHHEEDDILYFTTGTNNSQFYDTSDKGVGQVL